MAEQMKELFLFLGFSVLFLKIFMHGGSIEFVVKFTYCC
jgi:hypothetical protein